MLIVVASNITDSKVMHVERRSVTPSVIASAQTCVNMNIKGPCFMGFPIENVWEKFRVITGVSSIQINRY